MDEKRVESCQVWRTKNRILSSRDDRGRILSSRDDRGRILSSTVKDEMSTVGSCSRVDWFIIFFDFQKLALCCRSGIFFYESNSKNSYIWLRARQRFPFQKSQGPSKINRFLKICKYLLFTSKNNRQKENTKEEKNVRPPKRANLFLTWSKEKQFF